MSKLPRLHWIHLIGCFIPNLLDLILIAFCFTRLMPPLYDYAPGLLDLVSLAPDDEDLVISRPTGRSRSVKTKKATLKELSDSEDDNVDDENDDDSSQEDENNYDSDN